MFAAIIEAMVVVNILSLPQPCRGKLFIAGHDIVVPTMFGCKVPFSATIRSELIATIDLILCFSYILIDPMRNKNSTAVDDYFNANVSVDSVDAINNVSAKHFG